jgi:hypothetical protein
MHKTPAYAAARLSGLRGVWWTIEEDQEADSPLPWGAFLRGASTMTICRPSSFGMASTWTSSLKHTHSQLLVRHFAAAETQRDFGLVSVFDETAQVAQLDLVIAFIGAGAEFHLLDLDDLLLGTCFLLALLFLVLELAIIHQAADRRRCIGGNLDQIYFVLLGQAQRLGGLDHPKLLAVNADQTDFRYADFTVDAMRFFGCDV